MKNKTKNGNATHVGIHHACIWPLLTFNVDIHLAVTCTMVYSWSVCLGSNWDVIACPLRPTSITFFALFYTLVHTII